MSSQPLPVHKLSPRHADNHLIILLGCARPWQWSYLKEGSAKSLPQMLVHFLCTQCLQPLQKMELWPTPFLQTPGHNLLVPTSDTYPIISDTLFLGIPLSLALITMITTCNFHDFTCSGTEILWLDALPINASPNLEDQGITLVWPLPFDLFCRHGRHYQEYGKTRAIIALDIKLEHVNIPLTIR